MDDRISCRACGELLWPGPGEAPASVIGVGTQREPCPRCGSGAREGTVLVTERIGTAVDVVAMTARHQVGVDTLATGFIAALTRYHAAATRNAPGDTLYPLFEALNWSVSATDKLKHEVPSWDSTLAPDAAETVRGLRCARNVVHHAWDTLIEGENDGSTSVFTWRWRPLGQHAYKPNGRPRDGSQQYAAYLEGSDVAATLAVVSDVLLDATPAGRPTILQNAADLADRSATKRHPLR